MSGSRFLCSVIHWYASHLRPLLLFFNLLSDTFLLQSVSEQGQYSLRLLFLLICKVSFILIQACCRLSLSHPFLKRISLKLTPSTSFTHCPQPISFTRLIFSLVCKWQPMWKMPCSCLFGKQGPILWHVWHIMAVSSFTPKHHSETACDNSKSDSILKIHCILLYVKVLICEMLYYSYIFDVGREEWLLVVSDMLLSVQPSIFPSQHKTLAPGWSEFLNILIK